MPIKRDVKDKEIDNDEISEMPGKQLQKSSTIRPSIKTEEGVRKDELQ